MIKILSPVKIRQFLEERKLDMKLINDCGILIDDHKVIANKFISTYMQTLKSIHNSTWVLYSLGSKLISNLDNNELIKLSNFEETNNAPYIIDSHKTSWSDGLVWASLWTIGKSLRRILLSVFSNFSMNGKILKEINHTLIALLPQTNSGM